MILSALPLDIARHMLKFIDSIAILAVRRLCRVFWEAFRLDGSLTRRVRDMTLLQKLSIPINYRAHPPTYWGNLPYMLPFDCALYCAWNHAPLLVKANVDDFLDSGFSEDSRKFVEHAVTLMYGQHITVPLTRYSYILMHLQENDLVLSQRGDSSFALLRDFFKQARPRLLEYQWAQVITVSELPLAGRGMDMHCSACGRKIRGNYYCAPLMCFRHRFHLECAAVVIDIVGRERYHNCIGEFRQFTARGQPRKHATHCSHIFLSPQAKVLQRFMMRRLNCIKR